MNYFSLVNIAIILFVNSAIGQEKPIQGWHMMSIKDNKETAGIAANQAYELVKNREAKPVIVAVLDSGIDTTHEDLKGNLWVNLAEIPDNGIDDDGNGFIDDIHGWNFLGGDSGTVNYENLEYVRLYRYLNEKRWTGEEFTSEEKSAYEKYKAQYNHERKEAVEDLELYESFAQYYEITDEIMREYFGKEDYTLEEVRKCKPTTERQKAAKEFLTSLFTDGFTPEDLYAYKDQVEKDVMYKINLDYQPRKIVGDDPSNWSDSIYGNTDLMGLESDHGTHVAGIIGAIRDNRLGTDGIAGNVKIMVVRTVPLGDEYDKDVANAILYAVRNGAQVINMSFGKPMSPYNQWVEYAISVAENKGVIMVHGAGNDAENKDTILNYPISPLGIADPFWIEVGAHGNVKDKTYPADFSNYGANSVDIFAPGVDIYAPVPTTNKYDFKDGTSMAAPVVTGAVAFLLSYFPDLSPADVKRVLAESANQYGKLSVNLPNGGVGKAQKVKFETLNLGGRSLNLEAATKLLLAEEK